VYLLVGDRILLFPKAEGCNDLRKCIPFSSRKDEPSTIQLTLIYCVLGAMLCREGTFWVRSDLGALGSYSLVKAAGQLYCKGEYSQKRRHFLKLLLPYPGPAVVE